jgi:hypothetical protein
LQGSELQEEEESPFNKFSTHFICPRTAGLQVVAYRPSDKHRIELRRESQQLRPVKKRLRTGQVAARNEEVLSNSKERM